MRLHAWFNVIGGTVVSGLAFVAAYIAVTHREWIALSVFVVMEVVMLRGVARHASWLINQE